MIILGAILTLLVTIPILFFLVIQNGKARSNGNVEAMWLW